MSELFGFGIVVVFAISIGVAYGVGCYNGLKDVNLVKIKTERDMFEQRLTEWNENQRNI